MFVQGADLPQSYTDIIASELNVKKVSYIEDASGFSSYKVKPQLKTLGPRYGKLLKRISAYLQEGEGIGDIIVQAHKSNRNYEFELDGQPVLLSPEDVIVEIQKREGFVTEVDGNLAVVLDTTLTPELIDEGFVRELVSKIQTMRKEAGFEVTDNIVVGYESNARIDSIIESFGSEIADDTLAKGFVRDMDGDYSREWTINGETVKLSVSRVITAE